MLKVTEELIIKKHNIKSNAFEIFKKALEDVESDFKKLDEIREYNQLKVLSAFQDENN